MGPGRVVVTTLGVVLIAVACQSSGSASPSAVPSSATVAIPSATATLGSTERPSLSPLPTRAEATSPGAIATARPNPTATPMAPVRPWPSRSTWTELGSIKAGTEGSIEGVRRLTGGYLAWGRYGSDKNRDPLFATWFSTDGRSWARTVHAASIVPCPGWSERENFESVTAPASDGRALVFTVVLLVPDAANCERYQTIFLSTPDGHTWSRSDPLAGGVGGPPLADGGEGTLAWVEGLWAIPGGWEALVATEIKPTVTSDLDTPAKTIWRSSDLVTWVTIANWPAREGRALVFEVLGVAPDGIRLGASTGETVRSTLLSSSDAITWKPTRVLPSEFEAEHVVPPEKPGRPWLVVIGRGLPRLQARVLVSSDLAAWKTVSFPKPEIWGIEAVGTGWLAIGGWEAGGSATGAPTFRSLPYTSNDGLSWTACSRCRGPSGAFFAGTDGAGRLVAVDHEPSRGGLVRLWRLTLDD